jgi:hypothetical protein
MIQLITDMANSNIGSLCIFLNNKKNIEYLNYLNSVVTFDLSISEKVYYFVNNIKEELLCECGKRRAFIGFKKGHRLSCGDKLCYINIRKKTCIEKYGVDNPKKSKLIINKERENILNRWGGKHYMYDSLVRNKLNTSMMDNFGVKWAQQSISISNKSKETFNNNPNKDDIIKRRIIKILNKTDIEKKLILEKKLKTIIENWGSTENLYKHISNIVKEKSIINFGVDHHLSHPDIIDKRVSSYYSTITNRIKSILPDNIIYINRKINDNNTDNIIKLECLICNNKFDINRQYLVNRISIKNDICLHCNPVLSGKSNMELELLDFIKSIYNGIILTNTKSIINKELDIYLPELGIAFEFNGLYWHSDKYKDKNYHIDKTNDCSHIGIQLIHVWEDDWIYKKEQVKSILINKLNLSNRIFARKCEIKIVDNVQVRYFLNENHIQGFVGSKVKIGLFYNNELVSLMTFGSLRKSLGQINKEGSYELLRFCNKLGYSVVGGASKLFRYFLNNFNVKEVISYSDSSRSNGELYKKLGFEFSHQSIPNYYYIIDGVRKHRFNYRKDKLVKSGADIDKTESQIMFDKGYNRIFDCGSKKWIYKN